MLRGLVYSATPSPPSPSSSAGQSQLLSNTLGLPPPSPGAQPILRHLVVVSTSPDRPELDLPPVKTLRDEDRKLAPVSSPELQSHRSQAQHQRSRQNIKQEPGLWGQRQPTTLPTAKDQTPGKNFPRGNTSWPPCPPVHAFPLVQQGDGKLCPEPGQHLVWSGGGGTPCLHLVLGWAQAGMRS